MSSSNSSMLGSSPRSFKPKWTRNSFVVFHHAFSNSSATDVSMPSILTGVAPFESGHKLHEMPFLWDWGHAAGMRTWALSSFRYLRSRPVGSSFIAARA